MPKRPGEFPKTIKRFGLTAKLYRYERQKNGATYEDFILVWPEAGQAKRRSFPSAALAEAEAETQLQRVSQGIIGGADMTATDRADFGLAMQTMEPHGVPVSTACAEWSRATVQLAGKASIAEAVAYYLKNAHPDLPARSVRQVTDELLKHKETVDKASQVYLKDLRLRLDVVSRAFAGQEIKTITAPDLNRMLAKIEGSKRTRANFRSHVITLWRFAKAQGYLPRDRQTEAELCEVIKGAKDVGAVEIFAVEDVRAILAKQSYETLPFVAINAFSGLRNAEINRAEWQWFDWSTGYIHVPDDKSKVGEERFVPIHPNLREWLEPYRLHGCTGPINFGHAKVQAMAQKRAERSLLDADGNELLPATKWKRNGLRHSFISYRLAVLQNRAAVAEEAGNSVPMIQKHYRRPVLPETGKAYFEIRPSSDVIAQLVQFPKITTPHKATREPGDQVAVA